MEGLESIYVDLGKGKISDFHPRKSFNVQKIVAFVV